MFNRKGNARMCRVCSEAFRKGRVSEWEKRRRLIRFVGDKLEKVLELLPVLEGGEELKELKSAVASLNKKIEEVRRK